MPATAIANRPAAAPRILWLAVAEARGHLMRATLAQQLLSESGVAVDIVTTSRAGVEFAATFGATADVLPGAYHLVYDGQQNLARMRSRLAAVRYLAAGCSRDLAELAERARGAQLLVNDSFHPALLVAALGNGVLARRVVHLHCENTRLAVEATGGRGPLGLLVRASMMRARRIEIVVGDAAEHARFGESDAGGTIRLPALVALPRPRPIVRAERGVRPGERFAVVYLNPYFRDPALASAIEDALRGHRVHAVGEGFAGRPGWIARDPRLADAVAAADVFVSAPGAGAVTMARTFGTPLVAIATDQPEQRKNLDSCGVPPALRVVADREVRTRLAGALASVAAIPTPLDPAAEIRRARALWQRAFHDLVTRKDSP